MNDENKNSEIEILKLQMKFLLETIENQNVKLDSIIKERETLETNFNDSNRQIETLKKENSYLKQISNVAIDSIKKDSVNQKSDFGEMYHASNQHLQDSMNYDSEVIKKTISEKIETKLSEKQIKTTSTTREAKEGINFSGIIFEPEPAKMSVSREKKLPAYMLSIQPDNLTEQLVKSPALSRDSLNNLDRRTHTSDNVKPKRDLSKIFENFYIIGHKKNEEINLEKHPRIDILYSLHPTDKIEDEQKEQLAKFINPFLQKFKSVRVKNQINKINEVLFQEESSNKYLDFFPISLAAAEVNKINLPLAHLVPYLGEGQFDFELLRESNPDAFQFYYCLKLNDFFIYKDNDDPNSVMVYFCPRYFVIKTIYPFSRFFNDFLQQIVSSVKTKRIEKFMLTTQDGIINLANSSSIDCSNVLSCETELIISDIEKLNAVVIRSNFEKYIQIIFANSVQISYQLPGIKNAAFSEAEFGFAKAFSLFPFEDFMFILFSMINERSVIFVSEHQFYISACISSFISILRPFKWVFPVIFSLPENCLLMLSTPLPLMVGLNAPAAKVIGEIIPEIEEKFNVNSSPNVYVFLDHGLYYYDFESMDSVLLPQYDEFLEKIEKIFKKSFNTKSSNFFKINKVKKNKVVYNYIKKSNTTKLKEKLVRIESMNEPSLMDRLKISQVPLPQPDNQIFYFFRYFLNAFLISKLPCDRNLSHFGRETKIKEIDVAFFSTNASDVEFLEGFMKTQIFMYYLENDFFGITNPL